MRVRSKKRSVMLATLPLVSALLLTACADSPEADAGDSGDAQQTASVLEVVTSFTILEDMAHEIGGDLVEVHNLVPTGTDPHEYEPLPDDIRAAADADIMFANGLNLEGGEQGWFARLAQASGKPAEQVIEVARNIEPMYLGDGEAEQQINPHAFIDPRVGREMAAEIRDGLSSVDPDNAAEYKERAEEYIAKIEGIEQEYADRLGAIPEDQRVLVTSERAFQYLAATYGLTEMFIWEIDTEENGSPQQIVRLVEQLTEHPVPYLVRESNVDPRPMEMVSQQTGIPIFERPIYSDEIGSADEPEANTYLKYLEYNLDVLTDALGGNTAE